MIPKRIELENFLSFGKPAVEFTFSDDEPLWVLCGQNGVGKSAVFDGITYALYGEHRAGPQKAEQLIRHGANGFRVVLEFAFGDGDYRITRTRTRSGRTTQKVERSAEGRWEAIPGVNSAAEVKAWVKETLGLPFEAFTTSVLLRQGEADKLFSASRDDRLAVLKGIIGFERFEYTSDRVHAATVSRGNTLEGVRQQMSGLDPVAPEELAAAEVAAADAERRREEARTQLTAAVQRVEQAKQWEGLEAKRTALERQLAEAAERAADAAAIRADKDRLDDLAAAVPELESLVRLRDTIARLELRIATAKSGRDDTSTAIDAKAKALDETRQKAAHHKEQAEGFERRVKALDEEIERGGKFLQLADAVEGWKTKLTAYPPDLADQLTRAEADEKAAGENRQNALGALAAGAALLRQAQEKHDRFAEVAIGVVCSRCGQLVDEAHAAKEREHLANELQTWDTEVGRLRTGVTASEEGFSTAHKRRVSLQKDKAEFSKITVEFAATVASLTQLGGIADAAGLRSQLNEQEGERGRAEERAQEERVRQSEATGEADRLDGEWKQLIETRKDATDSIHTLEIDLSVARAAHDSGLTRLASGWQSRLPALDAEGVSELGTERDRLRTSGVVKRFEALRQDEAQQDAPRGQLNNVRSDIDLIPADARIAVTEAQRRLGEARDAAIRADDARDAAVQARDGLKSRAEQRERLTAQLRDAEREHDLHKKLDNLLGPKGLQRDLERDAEQQVVALANDTLQHLSDGDLSLEQDDEVAGRDDKAFALRVRRAGDPLPIGVLFLSGSQKFRVAVSVALAVGQFASGRARPLEAVIIDEGFGSLDKDGLRAMAEELKRLQQSQSLKRVILVSHQDEFADRFPVGYRLSPGDGGTTAMPFRQP